MFIRNFKILGQVALEISLMKYLIGEKKRTTEGNDKHEDADFSYTIQWLYPMFETNFKILGAVVPEKLA